MASGTSSSMRSRSCSRGDAHVIGLAGGAEEFEWMPEATELGWRREHNVVPAAGRDATPPRELVDRGDGRP